MKNLKKWLKVNNKKKKDLMLPLGMTKETESNLYHKLNNVITKIQDLVNLMNHTGLSMNQVLDKEIFNKTFVVKNSTRMLEVIKIIRVNLNTIFNTSNTDYILVYEDFSTLCIEVDTRLFKCNTEQQEKVYKAIKKILDFKEIIYKETYLNFPEILNHVI